MSPKTLKEQLAEQWVRRQKDGRRSQIEDPRDPSVSGAPVSCVRSTETKGGPKKHTLNEHPDWLKELEILLGTKFDAASLDAAVDRVIDTRVPSPWQCVDISVIKAHLYRWRLAVIDDTGNASRMFERILLFSRDARAASVLIDLVAECMFFAKGDNRVAQAGRFATLFQNKQEYQEALYRYTVRCEERDRRHKAELLEAEKHRIDEMRAPVQRIIDHILTTRFQVAFEEPALSAIDEALCHAWANLDVRNSQRSGQGLLDRLGSYHGMRLYSARQAELVASRYYRQLGKNVVDTSLLQVTKEGAEWKTHDLEVDGQLVDVKNARRAFSSPRSYSEHCVANWKKTARSGGPVSLAAVLSDYVTAERFQSGTLGSAVFLGEASLHDMKAASAWFEKWTTGKLSFLHLDTPTYFPGWIFDYPVEHYGGLIEKERVDEAIRLALGAGLPAACIPSWLLTWTCADFSGQFALSTAEAKLLGLIQDMGDGVGFSRMSATMFVLALFVRSICGIDHDTFKEDLLVKFIFPKDPQGNTDECRPFGRQDSESFVFTMLSALVTAERLARQELKSFKSFQLVGANVLRGFDENGVRTTVLAYCGGFRAKPPHVRCGKSPLVIGTSQVCPHCRYLICPSCGWCSEGCEQLSANPLRMTGLPNYIGDPFDGLSDI